MFSNLFQFNLLKESKSVWLSFHVRHFYFHYKIQLSHIFALMSLNLVTTALFIKIIFFFKSFCINNTWKHNFVKLVYKIKLFEKQLDNSRCFEQKNALFSLHGLQIYDVRSDKQRHRLSLFEDIFTLASIKRSRKTILNRKIKYVISLGCPKIGV